jgi:eukaryotic-like serine/threonine-protein kinase
VLKPAATVELVLRGISRLRLRYGSLMLAMIHLAGAGQAAIVFVADPFAI